MLFKYEGGGSVFFGVCSLVLVLFEFSVVSRNPLTVYMTVNQICWHAYVVHVLT